MPLIVGLGNPGAAFEGTLHNVGFDVVQRLAQQAGVRFRTVRLRRAEEAVIREAERTIVLLKPLAYMNQSGGPVAAALRRHGCQPTDLLVICDDVNLPLGHIRLRPHGGAGGHHGLASIIQQLGTEKFPRLRIGVGGGEPGADVAKHVLAVLPPSERERLATIVELAAQAVACFVQHGLDAAMNRFNTRRMRNKNPSGGTSTPDNHCPQGEA